MTSDTKEQVKSAGKTTGVVALGAAVVAVISSIVLAPVQPKTATLLWDYPAQDLPEVIFEVVSKTNLTAPWQFYTNVTATNRLTIPTAKVQEFFTISRVIWRVNTNAQIKQKGF